MEYSPYYRKSAEKYLDNQTKIAQIRIMDAVDKLPEGNVKKLQGREGYRLTVGGFRIIFDYTNETTEDDKIIIDIIAIGPRGDIYKR